MDERGLPPEEEEDNGLIWQPMWNLTLLGPKVTMDGMEPDEVAHEYLVKKHKCEWLGQRVR